MRESWTSQFTRWFFNLVPVYRGTGGRVTYIAGDWHTIKVKLPLSLRTRNYVGTIFGGSMYSAVDPFYMFMLIKILGKEYVVWDKSATISFKKPGTTTLYATFHFTQDEIESIKGELEIERSIERVYPIHLKDEEGTTCALIEKRIYLRKGAY